MSKQPVSYYQRNKKKIAKQSRSRYLVDSEFRRKKLLQRHNHSYSVYGRYLHAQTLAKQRGKSFSISFKQFEELSKENCFWCLRPFKRGMGTGMDRVNNNRGYEENNVVACCHKCNSSKGNKSILELSNWKPPNQRVVPIAKVQLDLLKKIELIK